MEAEMKVLRKSWILKSVFYDHLKENALKAGPWDLNKAATHY